MNRISLCNFSYLFLLAPIQVFTRIQSHLDQKLIVLTNEVILGQNIPELWKNVKIYEVKKAVVLGNC